MAKWLELSIRTTPEYVEPLSELFRRYGEGSVVVEEEGDWDPDNDTADPGPPTSVVVKTYMPVDATTVNRRGMIDVGVRLVSLLQPMDGLQGRFLEEEEWENAWKAHFTLLRVGKRLIIKPTWQEYASSGAEVLVELDPGMAFGTGHHPTTRMCLEELEQRVRPGMQILDLGTGSGILAIAAVKLGVASVVALDVDSMAVKAAGENIQYNRVTRKVRLFAGTLPNPKVLPGSMDLVVANITARAIAEVARPIAEALAPGGVLIASGIIMERQADVETALQGVMVIRERRTDGDWVTLVAER
jgi:ribosomal protein L11 methyltransferase